jgi:hypothetical protein
MTEKTLKEAQDFLTITRDDQVKRLIDIELLLERYPTTIVLSFLKDLLKEKQKALRDLVVTDKTTPRVNTVIGNMFRIHMAIRTIERETEVKAA